MISTVLAILFEAAVRALLAACVLWAGLRLFRVKNLLAQKAAWSLVLAAAWAMPLLLPLQWLPAWAAIKLPAATWSGGFDAAVPSSAPVPAVPVSLSRVPEPMPQPAPGVEDQFPAPAASASEFQAPQTTLMPAPASAPPASVPVANNLPALLFAFGWFLYLVVCATLLTRLLWGLATSLRLWNEAQSIEARPNLDVPDDLNVRWSRRIASPVNIGSGILLPADYAQWCDEKLQVVLAHERSHIRQRDFYLQLLAGLYAALTWFSPLGWWLKRKLSELGEAISDHAGLKAAASPSSYAELLFEFAALPRPTFAGVAMAHSTNLSQRIERLLNESSFRQAFAGGRRAVVAVLVPCVLITAAALVRVEAATASHQDGSAQVAKLSTDSLPSQSALTGQSNPDPAQVSDQGSGQAPPAASPEPAPAPAPAPSAAPAPDAALPMPPIPAGPSQESEPAMPAIPPIPPVHVEVHVPPIPAIAYAYGYQGQAHGYGPGEAYAIVGDPGSKPRFFGAWDVDRSGEIEKARKIAHGHFLLFRHDGKSYIVDDPAIVSQIDAMDKSLQDTGNQMRALGKQMRDPGQQQREAGRKAREASRTIPTPDLSKEMADLNAAVASLQAHQGTTITREQLAQIQRAINELQRRLIGAQVKVDLNMSSAMGEFGVEQGKFGEEMGKLGAEMGRAARENARKTHEIIDQSLKDGKARPVD